LRHADLSPADPQITKGKKAYFASGVISDGAQGNFVS